MTKDAAQRRIRTFYKAVMEERITFISQSHRLEGRLLRANPGMGVIITHPHPLYGGDMNNLVVTIAARAYEKAGFTTLRFNFRGTGSSEGIFDHGLGEAEDLLAAAVFLADSGIAVRDIAGYSFGAWVAARAQSHFDRENLLLISPPLSFLDFSSLPLSRPAFVVTGSDDELAPVEEVQAYLKEATAPVHLEVIPGGDHFYSGFREHVSSIIGEYATRRASQIAT